MRKIPINDLKAQVTPIRAEIDVALKEVIDGASFVGGSAVAEFESAVEQYCGIKYAVACSNGSDALRLAMLASGIRAGDGVICPSFTYYASAGSIVAIGCRPFFADIDPVTYNISVDGIEKILKRNRRVKAIMPVHLYGQCADMDPIKNIARKYRLKVIEDNAQAFGAEYKGKKAGTLGNAAGVSFFPGKNLGAFGDAGMCLTNDKRTADMLRLLRNQGNKQKYRHTVIGFNNRMDSLQAAVLKVKLRHLDLWNDMRRRNAEYYNANLSGPGINTPFVAGFSTHTYHQYVLRLDRPSDGLMKHLNAAGIDARVYYPLALHAQPCFKYLGYKRGDFPESEKAARATLALPVYPEMTTDDLDYVIKTIKEYIK